MDALRSSSGNRNWLWRGASPYRVNMRWDALFDDLEGQLGAARGDEWRAEVSERTRGERAAVDLASRLAGARGSEISVALSDGERVSGALSDSGSGWLLLVDAGARQHLIAEGALVTVTGLQGAAHHVTEVERRLGLTHVLRALSRDRARVRVRTAGGEVHGVIAAVLGDHIDVVADATSRSRVAVPLAAIVEVVSV